MSDLTVTVEILAGTHIAKAADQMQALCDRLGVSVRAEFNEVVCVAVAGGTAAHLEQRFEWESAKATGPYVIRLALSR